MTKAKVYGAGEIHVRWAVEGAYSNNGISRIIQKYNENWTVDVFSRI